MNAIAPAAMTRALIELSKINPKISKATAAANPMGRMGDPYDDISPAALFFASEGSQYVTGNTMFVDGGGHINGVVWTPDLDA